MAREHKGKRGHINTRAPLTHHNTYQARADDLGLDLGDYSVLVMARAHGLPVPDYIARRVDTAKLLRHDEQYALALTPDGELAEAIGA
jgi:hypothetical protein